MPKRAPESRSVARARLSRCPIVASGTRNAAAICAVVSPDTARRVRATWEERPQRRVAAEQQQLEAVVSPAVLGAGRLGLHGQPPRPARALVGRARGRSGAWRRRGSASRARWRAYPRPGPLARGRLQRLLRGILAGPRSPVQPQQRSRARAATLAATRPRARASLTGRRRPATSWRAARRCRPGSRTRRDLLGALLALDVDQEEAGEVLLGLGVGPVGGERLPVCPAVQPRRGRRRRAPPRRAARRARESSPSRRSKSAFIAARSLLGQGLELGRRSRRSGVPTAAGWSGSGSRTSRGAPLGGCSPGTSEPHSGIRHTLPGWPSC